MFAEHFARNSVALVVRDKLRIILEQPDCPLVTPLQNRCLRYEVAQTFPFVDGRSRLGLLLMPFDALDKPRLVVDRGIGIVETLDIGKDDSQIGPDQAGHQRTERIVVAEADLLDRNGVVLVDDGDHAQI